MTISRVRARTTFSLMALLLTVTSQSQADSVSFVEVASTTTSIPGGTGSFSGFGIPAINGSYIAFDASGSNSQQGIYVWSQAGGLRRVTDNNGTGFSSFYSPTVDSNGTVAFLGQGNATGVYTGVGGGSSLTTVATAGSTVPGSPGGSFFFNPLDSRPVSIDNGVVAFEAWSRSGGNVNEGIYTGPSSGGALSLVADRSTLLPYGTGSTQMIFFNGPVVNNGQVLFNATTGSITQESGVYALINGSIVRVIDSTQTLPGTSVAFISSEGPGITPGAIADGRVAFWANGGYYGMNKDGTLTQLATTTNTPPGSSQPFIETYSLGLNANGSYLFTGQTASGDALYYSPSFTSGDYVRLIGAGDQLDGKSISDVFTYPYSLSGNDFVTEVRFTDGSQAIYEGIIGAQSVPEPGSLVLLAVGIGGRLRLPLPIAPSPMTHDRVASGDTLTSVSPEATGRSRRRHSRTRGTSLGLGHRYIDARDPVPGRSQSGLSPQPSCPERSGDRPDTEPDQAESDEDSQGIPGQDEGDHVRERFRTKADPLEPENDTRNGPNMAKVSVTG